MARKIIGHSVQYRDADGDKAFAYFAADDSAGAWNFMRLCDSLGVSSGFPDTVFA